VTHPNIYRVGREELVVFAGCDPDKGGLPGAISVLRFSELLLSVFSMQELSTYFADVLT
jgi:hypothetical protein